MLPIGEDNGIVEWVLNTTGLRHCLADVYTAAGLFDRNTLRNIQRVWEGAPPVRHSRAAASELCNGCGSGTSTARIALPANLPPPPPLPPL